MPISELTFDILCLIPKIYVKNCSVYIQCKGDIVVVDIKQHKSQF